MNTSQVPSVPHPSADPQRGALSVTSGSALVARLRTRGRRIVKDCDCTECDLLRAAEEIERLQNEVFVASTDLAILAEIGSRLLAAVRRSIPDWPLGEEERQITQEWERRASPNSISPKDSR